MTEFKIEDYFKKIDVLDKGYVELFDGMHIDPLLKIVNSARVSFAKESRVLTDRDKKLIDYLIEHEHFSTLRHTYFSFRLKAPLFVFRQSWKHQIGSEWVEGDVGEIQMPETNWNEVSGRYVEWKPEFYVPRELRRQSEDNKQASTDEIVDKIDGVSAIWIYENSQIASYNAYKQLIDNGVSKEQARALLPQSLYSECIWTISLQGLLYWLKLRSDDHAQWEIRQYAETIREIMSDMLEGLI